MSSISVDGLVGRSQEALVVGDRDGARILIINRPAMRNAMSYDFRRSYAEALAAAETDEAVKVLIVTGANGDFSSGVDLKDARANPGRPMYRPHPGEATRAMGKPVIAAVDGYCLTGALELALSCSFILATDRARFGDTHAKAGRFPGWGQSAMLPRAIGVRRARQMAFTGELIDARRAYEWGLVNEMTTPENLLPRCLEISAAIQACNPDSVSDQVQVYSRNDGTPLDVALAAEETVHRRWRLSKY
jgi:enoyl-CoA hydratase